MGVADLAEVEELSLLQSRLLFDVLDFDQFLKRFQQ